MIRIVLCWNFACPLLDIKLNILHMVALLAVAMAIQYAWSDAVWKSIHQIVLVLSHYALYSSTKYFECQRSNGTSNKAAEEKIFDRFSTTLGHRQCVTTTNNFCFSFSFSHEFRISTQNLVPQVYKRSIFAASYPIEIKMCVAYRIESYSIFSARTTEHEIKCHQYL